MEYVTSWPSHHTRGCSAVVMRREKETRVMRDLDCRNSRLQRSSARSHLGPPSL